ncbi:MAG: CsbD family protein [Ilumatobacteraceae bacterium]
MSGKTDKAKGKVKQAVGDLTGNKKLRREGKIDEVAGRAKEAIDKIKEKITPVRGSE